MSGSLKKLDEIMGLKWNKVDFKNRTIRIESNLLYTKEKGIFIDNIAHKLRDEYKEDENDPEMEINPGKFPNGGEREIIYYLDELGRTVPKSKAKKIARMEMDSKGNVLFKEEKEI
jgi:integrase